MRTTQDRTGNGTASDGAAIPEQRGNERVTNGPPEHNGGGWDGREAWTGRTRVVLSPVAAPSILGLFGFAGATFMVASLLAGWWGDPTTAAPIIAPFALFFGGLAQFMAGMWSYRARDGLATAMHGTWGSFWLGWGTLVLLTAGGVLPTSVLESRAMGFWFIVLCVITTFGALAALGESMALFTVLGLLAAGSGLLAAGWVGSLPFLITVGGWVLVASAAAAFYTAGAMMLAESAKGRTVLPLGKYQAAANIPGRRVMDPIGYSSGMPGAKVGQ